MSTIFEFGKIEIPTDGNLIIDSVILPKANYNSSVIPTVSNDDTEGYSVGSIWIDISENIGHLCVDNSTGAAIWNRLTYVPSYWTEFGTEATSEITIGSIDNDTTIYGKSISILTDASGGTMNIGTDGSSGSMFIGNTSRTVDIGYNTFSLNTTDISIDNTTLSLNKQYIEITTDSSGGTIDIGTNDSSGIITIGNVSRDIQIESSQFSVDASSTIDIGTDASGTGTITIGNISRDVNIDATLQINGTDVGKWNGWDISENSILFNIDMSGGTNQYARVNEILYLMFDFYLTDVSGNQEFISIYSLPVSPSGSGRTSSIISIQNITTPGYNNGTFEITGGDTTISIKYSFISGEEYRITGQIYYNV